MSRADRFDLNFVLYCLVFVFGFSWTLYIALSSPGVPVQDEIGHYLLSKNAWQKPELIFNLWGRPVRNVTYLIPALWGFTTARIFSIIITASTIIITTQIGRLVGIKRLYLIPLFIWFQPWVSALSFAVLPQVPFGFLLVLGIYLGLKEKYVGASLAFGLLPLTRHEGVAILGIWLLFVVFLRNWKAIWFAFIPLILFNIAYFIVINDFAFKIYLSAQPTDRYGNGDWLHYIRPLPGNVGTLLLMFCGMSIIPIIQRRKKILIFVPYLVYLAIHMVLFRYGLFASGGYQLFLLPMAPAFGLSAVIGCEYFLGILNRGGNYLPKLGRFSYTTALIIAIGIFVISAGLTTKPIPMDDEGKALQQAIDWLESQNIERDKVVATHVWFAYLYDLVTSYPLPSINEFPAGTIIVWDSHYSNRRNIHYEQLTNLENCWAKLASFGEDDFTVLFEKKSETLPCK